jgi:hypothetical protein
MTNAARKGCLVAAIALVCALPASSLAEPTCSAQVDPTSGAAGDLLLSVTGPPEHAVAVGMHFVGGDGTPFVTERVGDRWQRVRVSTAPGARTIELQDATTAGPRTWVVGAFRNDRPQAGWVSGGVWHWTHPIDPGEGEDEFLGVTATPDGTVWAVGKHQVGADYQPLIERFDGTRWSVVASPNVTGSAVLKDIALAPGGMLYAVGWRVLDGGETGPLALRSPGGGAWTVDPTPGSGLLSGVAIEPGGAPIAVGWRSTADGDRVLTLQRRSGWTPIGAATGDPGRLTAVAAGESTVAVGLRFADGIPTPTVVRLSGGWVPVAVAGEPAPEPGGDQLLGVTGELGAFLAVGIRDSTDSFASLMVAGDCAG